MLHDQRVAEFREHGPFFPSTHPIPSPSSSFSSLHRNLQGDDDDDSGPGTGRGRQAPRVVPSGPARDPRPPSAHLPVVCARCHALRHYGRVHASEAEASMPSFDFAAAVASKMRGEYAYRATVLVLVDVTDFDGSFPRSAVSLLSPSSSSAGGAPGPKVVLAATKVDLLPPASHSSRLVSRGLENSVSAERRVASAGSAPKWAELRASPGWPAARLALLGGSDA